MAKKSSSQESEQESSPPGSPAPPDRVIIDLDDDQVSGLLELASVADKLPQILAAVNQVGPQVGIVEVARKVCRRVKVPFPTVRTALLALSYLYHAEVNLGLNAEATLQVFTQNLGRRAKGQLKIWKDAKEKVIQAIESLNPVHPLEVSSKAYRVAVSRANLVVEMEFSTEARPVFDDSGEKVLLTLISHTLTLEYHKGPGHREIMLSLDAEDVALLRELCEEAERQAAILKDDLKQAPWPASIIFDPTDAGEGNE